MAHFGQEYSSNDVFFIAGGRTLELIKQFEDDLKNSKTLIAKLAAEYGAEELRLSCSFDKSGTHFIFKQATNNPALKQYQFTYKDMVVYEVDTATPEGRSLLERIQDIPQPPMFVDSQILSKRLTGVREIATNPDELWGLSDHFEGDTGFKRGHKTTSAGYNKYGDVYVVRIPRVVRGIFNEASQKETKEHDCPMAAGYRYEWFTPPDSQQVPYSKVIELKEQALGDQLAPCQVMKATTSTLRRT